MHPPALLTVAGLSLGFYLARHLRIAGRRRRGISPAALRVHLALQRYRRELGPGPDGLVEADVEVLRGLLSGSRRQRWDEAMQAYREARSEALSEDIFGEARLGNVGEITRHLDRLLAISAAP